MSSPEKARILRDSLPSGGLFYAKSWRIAPDPLRLPEALHDQIRELGQRLHAFAKACNLLYRQSLEGKQPAWIHHYLDLGKPSRVLELSREKIWKNELPCVLRPDLLLTDGGLVMTELDSIPGGIGLTAWLQTVYRQTGQNLSSSTMLEGFRSALQSKALSNAPVNAPPLDSKHIAIVVSEESRDYRPEMEWLAQQIPEVKICSPEDLKYSHSGIYLGATKLDAIYRFFELFDLPNISHIEDLIAAAQKKLVVITPPLKAHLEEKLWFALFCFPQLWPFWREQLGDRYARDLKQIIPFTWLLDPSPLPPHAVIPQLEIQDWRQLASFSQKQRDLILKISGFSERAWGSRGVFLGSDMPSDEWKQVVAEALHEFSRNPYILQRFAKPKVIKHSWFDFEKNALASMQGRVRLCPYYFVKSDKAELHGILATICPADKKLIHGMQDAILTLAEPDPAFEAKNS